MTDLGFQFLVTPCIFSCLGPYVHFRTVPSCVTKTVTRLTADPGVESSILVRSHTFVELDHEIISMPFLLGPLIQVELLLVTNESMCTKYWLTA